MLLPRRESILRKRSEGSRRWSLSFSVKKPSKIGILWLTKIRFKWWPMSFRPLKWFPKIKWFGVMKTLWGSFQSRRLLIFSLVSGSWSTKSLTESTVLPIPSTTTCAKLRTSSKSKSKNLTGSSLLASKTEKSLKRNLSTTWWVKTITSSDTQQWLWSCCNVRTTTQCSRKSFSSTECHRKLLLSATVSSSVSPRQPTFFARSTASAVPIFTRWSSQSR